jgi:hypothetical protein
MRYPIPNCFRVALTLGQVRVLKPLGAIGERLDYPNNSVADSLAISLAHEVQAPTPGTFVVPRDAQIATRKDLSRRWRDRAPCRGGPVLANWPNRYLVLAEIG